MPPGWDRRKLIYNALYNEKDLRYIIAIGRTCAIPYSESDDEKSNPEGCVRENRLALEAVSQSIG